MITGREPTAEDMEPLSWALFELCRRSTRSRPAGRAPAAGRRRARSCVVAQYDALLTPALAEAPVHARHDRPAARRPDGRLHALRALHALHGDREHHRLAGDLAAALPARGRAAGLPARRPAHRPAGGRGRAAGAGRAARGRPAVGRPPRRRSPERRAGRGPSAAALAGLLHEAVVPAGAAPWRAARLGDGRGRCSARPRVDRPHGAERRRPAATGTCGVAAGRPEATAPAAPPRLRRERAAASSTRRAAWPASCWSIAMRCPGSSPKSATPCAEGASPSPPTGSATACRSRVEARRARSRRHPAAAGTPAWQPRRGQWQRRQPSAQHVAIAVARRPAPGRRRCRGEVIETSMSSASSQVAGALDFMRASISAQVAARRSAWARARAAAAAAGAQRRRDDPVVRERLRPRELERSAGPAPRSTTAVIAVGDVVGPDRLVLGRPRAADRHDRQERQPVAASVRKRSPRSLDERRRDDRVRRRGPRPPARPGPWRAGTARGCGARPGPRRRTRSAATPARSAASTIRQVAMPLSSSIEPRGWSRIGRQVHDGVTPRSALRNEGGSARSPSAIWTRTRSGRAGAGRGRGSARARPPP